MSDFSSRVVAAATQGAVGAVVAASLSAVSEPVANRVQTERCTLLEAIKKVDPEHTRKYFKTTLSTNFIKFPLFEATNVIMSSLDMPPALRGTATGVVFTTITLPITNYRFMKSLGKPVDMGALYKAYLPTVVRDVIYGIVRNSAMGTMSSKFNGKKNSGKFAITFLCVAAACLASSPLNDLRGYMLQDPARRPPFKDYFALNKFLRATMIGTTIMSTSLAAGSLATAPVEARLRLIKALIANDPSMGLLLVLFGLHQALTMRRHSQIVGALAQQPRQAAA